MRYFIPLIFLFLSACVGPDKALHFAAGLTASTIITEVTGDQRLGCVASTTLGIGKELYDEHIVDSYFDPLDAVFTAASCIFTLDRDF